MTKKEQATFIWTHQYLSVRKPANLTEPAKQAWALMLTIAHDLKVFRQFNPPVYRLFQTGITKSCARARRTRMVHHPLYQANAFLAKALKKIRKDKFDTMIVFLGRGDGQRTNHHVERHNRVCRMMQKTRYKRRKTHTIEQALELERYARLLEHSLYLANVRRLPTVSPETVTLKMAA